MREIATLVSFFEQDFRHRLRNAAYLYGDTRIVHVSLYDHLALTAGFAVAMVDELCRRGKIPRDICGVDISDEELRALARICGLIHDIGKAREGETDYRRHVPRGLEYAGEWLAQRNVEEPLRSVILGTIARHHLRDNPQTVLEKVICLADSYASAGDRPELAQARTILEFEQAARQTMALEREVFGEDAPISLLLGDADAIKSYVYETSVLPEIRGGSEILQMLEKEICERFDKKLAKECLIYCGGGGFLAIVPASAAETWRTDLEQVYLQKTALTTITIVASEPLRYADIGRGLMPYDDAQVNTLTGRGSAADLLFSHFEALVPERRRRKNFGELVTKLTGHLQQAKRQKSISPFVETLPVHHRCESCGKRAAIRRDERRDEWLCFICHQKRQVGREERREFVDEVADRVESLTKVKILKGKGALPEDLDDLADREGRIALLYADGNNIGDLLQLAPSAASYRHISETLNTATREALFDAIWQVFGEKRLTREPLPFEIIALGGDDVVVIVPASAAWRLTLHMLDNFEKHGRVQRLGEEIRERIGWSEKLSMSAGLVIADVKYPVGFLLMLAEDLLNDAKKLAREAKTSTLCHLWLRVSVISEDAKKIIASLYERDGRGMNVRLTARPYTVEQGRRLLDIAQDLAMWPTSQRRILAESVEKGVHVSLNYALYQAARQRGKKPDLQSIYSRLKDIVANSGESPDTFWFWAEKKDEDFWQTAVLDVLELIELGATVDGGTA